MPLSSTAGLKLAPPALIQGSKAPELEELEDEDELLDELEDELEELDEEELAEELEELARPEVELVELEDDELEDELDAVPSGPLQAAVASAANRVNAGKAIRLMAGLLNNKEAYSAEPCLARL